MGFFSFLARKNKKSSSNNTNQEQSSSSSTNSSLVMKRSSTQVKELEAVFNKFDVNGDGKISMSELGSIMMSLGYNASEEELSKMMKEADLDGDGFIDLNEFVEMNTKEVDSKEEIEDLRNAFKVFDADKNGLISREELCNVMRSVGDSCSIEDCKRMISGVDSDGDGQINFEEFKVMMMRGRGFASGSWS
ncbi:hypothetical protein Sjap_024646 [Stephania japonica]|uniref:EF-hand domain-containing protein n=1 Tax=Stephania japonica TaxID=461633 RepID=A0AAP0HLP6_9MAGN